MYSSLQASFGDNAPARSHQFVWSVAVATIVHVAGLIGMIWGDPVWFSSKTPLNLLLMCLLLLLNQPRRDAGFYLFMVMGFATGMLTEMIGVQTGMLFGTYAYGAILGPSWKGVPFLIGVNWFVTVFISIGLARAIIDRIMADGHDFMFTRTGRFFVLPLTGAAVATVFDWIMEPAAVTLGFWTWAGDGSIPMLNYICWFTISWLLLTAGMLLRIDIRNRFSIPLLIIQSVFFMLLRLLD
jgi:putative membrane protein